MKEYSWHKYTISGENNQVSNDREFLNHCRYEEKHYAKSKDKEIIQVFVKSNKIDGKFTLNKSYLWRNDSSVIFIYIYIYLMNDL